MREIASTGLELRVIAAGMHLRPEFGDTVREIASDGIDIDARVPMADPDDTPTAMVRSIGEGVLGLSDAFESLGPDVVVVLGDRVEAFAAAIAAAGSNRAVAHIHGGDVTRGGFDESMRHAITKLAHLHFAATERSRARILKMGEPADRVFTVGAPGLDSLRLLVPLGRAEVAERIGAPLDGPFLVLLQHPVSTSAAAAAGEIEETIAALREIGRRTVCIYPNSDAGGQAMIATIEHARGEPWLTVAPNLAHDVYLNLLRHAAALVGNSSSGIIESAALRLPVVNIGPRQAGRERGENVIDVPPRRADVAAAVRRALSVDFKTVAGAARNPYGDGHAAERIARALRAVRITPEWLQKQLAY
jgi:UDP-N-acetylglucosamine 2-epimerase (non-hydrolysing)/GDP/UDP-N,N'-diacetylbacillosamine 2-epimerase (hydrolysing)